MNEHDYWWVFIFHLFSFSFLDFVSHKVEKENTWVLKLSFWCFHLSVLFGVSHSQHWRTHPPLRVSARLSLVNEKNFHWEWDLRFLQSFSCAASAAKFHPFVCQFIWFRPRMIETRKKFVFSFSNVRIVRCEQSESAVSCEWKLWQFLSLHINVDICRCEKLIISLWLELVMKLLSRPRRRCDFFSSSSENFYLCQCSMSFTFCLSLWISPYLSHVIGNIFSRYYSPYWRMDDELLSSR